MEIGKYQILQVEKQVDFGVYLKETDDTKGKRAREAASGDAAQEHVLLPKSQVPEGIKTGDLVEVFLYKDSEDRLIATRKKPRLLLGEVGYLKVVQVGRIGAFLDWGLDKDLLLPYSEQPRERVKEGQEVLAAVYQDKSGRLCATMNVYPYLRKDSPYKTGDQVTGIVYETSRNFGAFVAVDSMYSALIPVREVMRPLRVGETVSARVTNVKPDGKLDLSLREKGVLQMDRDMETILGALKKEGGTLPVSDKSDPELIRGKLGMSKGAFKRAAGHLYKEGKIEIGEEQISLRRGER